MKTIRLIPRGKPSPGACWFDKDPIEVVLEIETDTEWKGKPTANPACPALTWPKFAWEEVLP